MSLENGYGIAEFSADARRIMEVEGGIQDRAAAVGQLEPLLKRALDGPGWTHPQYATIVGDDSPG